MATKKKRPAPRCQVCLHSEADHMSDDPKDTSCWNGSGNGSRCTCQAYED